MKSDSSYNLRYWLCVPLILGPTFIFGLLGNPATMGIALASGCIASAFLNLDKFKRIKALEFEADLRDTIERAEVTLEQVQQLSRGLISAQIHQLTHSKRLLSGELEEPSHVEKLFEISVKLGIAKCSDIQTCFDEYWRYYKADLLYAICSKYPANSSVCAELDQLRRDIISNGLDEFPTSDEISKIVSGNPSNNPDGLKKAIDAYNSFERPSSPAPQS